MKESAILFSHARSNLKATMDKACDNHQSILIIRKDGKNVVLLSEEDYDSMIETLYLMASKVNLERIGESLKNKGGKAYKSVSELRKKYKIAKC